jgi:hypothetical protein
LSENIKNSISEVVTFLNKITPNYANSNLENFKKKYIEQYEEAEMPLSQILDVENGIDIQTRMFLG